MGLSEVLGIEEAARAASSPRKREALSAVPAEEPAAS
jgi:hypothetical protein